MASGRGGFQKVEEGGRRGGGVKMVLTGRESRGKKGI